MKKFIIRELYSVMGIDTSSKKTGVAIMLQGELIYKDNIIRGKDESLTEYFIKLENVITEVINKHNVKYVGMEDLSHSTNFKTSKALMKVQGVVSYVVYLSTGNEIELYHNATWRSRLGIKNIKHEYEMKEVTNKKTGKIELKKTKIKQKIEFKGKMVPNDIKVSTLIKINGLYNLNLTYKENDIADAIGVCYAMSLDVRNILGGKNGNT